MAINGPGQVHAQSIPFDTDLLGLHVLDPARYPALIESAADDNHLGRFDMLFAFPGERLQLDATGFLTGFHGSGQTDFLGAFDDWWRELRVPVDRGNVAPFGGGWFVLLGYELANEIEPHLELPADPRQPVAVALRIPVAVIRDRATAAAWIVAEAGHEAAVENIRGDIERLPGATDAPGRRGASLVEDLREDDAEPFLRAVAEAQAHIAAGDIYQANLSRRWTGKLAAGATAADIYVELRRTNPAPFAGILALPGLAVISSSPERLLRSDAAHVETRPIAGTSPRESGGGDAGGRLALRRHPKERAEHVMLIDLERNDLGRVCKAGTVDVDEFMTVETYAHVHHIVSNVRGEL
ncbi:MAG: chorismate-binding protein, partial [Gammaproteobacteria bacterium]